MVDESIPHPGVRFPPPLLFVAGWLIGWAIHRRWPLRIVPSDRVDTGEVGGLAIGVLGIAVIAWAFTTFLRHRTAIYPNQPAARVVRDGPFGYSRNPMYVGMSLIYIGVALFANAWPPILLLPLVLALLVTLVVAREERYLRSAFGDDYAAYCRDVRRWL